MTRTPLPRLDRSRAALLAGLAIDNFGSGLFLPLALLYATRVVDLGIDVAGAVVAAASVLGFGVPPVAGRLTQRVGPKAVVVVSQLVQGAGAAAYLLATGPVGVFLAAGLLAVGTQLFYCAVFVLIADVSTNEAKERPFALVAMLRAAAFGLGTVSAAVVLSWGSDRALGWLVAVDAATFLVAAAILGRYVETGRVDHEPTTTAGPRTVLRDRSYVVLIAAVCAVGLAVDFAIVGTPVFVVDVLEGPPWLPGALLAFGTLLSSAYGVKVVDLLRGRRRTRVMRVASGIFAAWGLVMLGMTWVPGWWLVPYGFLAWVVLMAGTKMFFPFAGALSEAMPPRSARAGYMAIYQYAFTAAQVLAPAVVGLFAVAVWLPWVVVVGAALGGVLLLGHLGRRLPVPVDRPVPAGEVVGTG
ncbi:MAG TPA: MFS transporter [Nocardioidaceae bacterium]|nr:MFS transporter [Nocardioidaceae bacterium]